MSSWGLPIATVKPRPWRVRDRPLGGDRRLLLGIVNVTPDSFFDGGRFEGPGRIDAVLARCEELVSGGADILDVGGESTRPGALPVAEAEERERVVPAIEAIVRRFDVPVSVD